MTDDSRGVGERRDGPPPKPPLPPRPPPLPPVDQPVWSKSGNSSCWDKVRLEEKFEGRA